MDQEKIFEKAKELGELIAHSDLKPTGLCPATRPQWI